MSDHSSLFVRLRRRWLRSERGAVVDSAAIFLAMTVLALAFDSTGASVSSLPALHHAYVSLQGALQSTNSNLHQGQSTGPLLSGLHDLLHSAGHAVEGFSADVHRLLQRLLQHQS